MSRKMKNEKVSCRDPEPALKKLLDSGKSQDKGLIYLYCLTNKVPKLPRPGIEMKAGKEIENLVDKPYFVYYQDLYAIVNNVKESEFDEENLKRNLADLEWIKTKAGIHEKAIETVMKNSCVIPFKFGTIFNTEENLKIMLKKHISKFKATLKYLEGKEEWGVKIYCDIDKLKGNLIREDKEFLNIDKEINSTSPGKAFILKKKKVELVNTSVNKKLNDYGQLIFEKLNQHSIESRINKLLPKEVTERKEEMILNSAFLIKKNKVANFIEAESALKEIFQEMGFFLDCTGPWPPYNFCEATTYGAKCQP